MDSSAKRLACRSSAGLAERKISGPCGRRKSEAPADGAHRVSGFDRLPFSFLLEGVFLCGLHSDDRCGPAPGSRLDAASVESIATGLETSPSSRGHSRCG